MALNLRFAAFCLTGFAICVATVAAQLPEPSPFVPDCGLEYGAGSPGESRLACSPQQTLPRCDAGLKVDNRGTLLNPLDDVCVNDTRHQVGSQFRSTWADWALANQRILAIDEPYNWVMRLVTHNAFNNRADGFVIDPNQIWSLSDQLDLGSRGLALDLHWVPLAGLQMCHGEAPLGFCYPPGTVPSELRPFAYGIREIADWLQRNPDELVYLDFEHYVEDHLDDVIAPLDAFFGAKLYRGPLTPIPETPIPPASLWPSTRQLRAMGKQVIIGAGPGPDHANVTFNGRAHVNIRWNALETRDIRYLVVEKTPDGIVTGCTSEPETSSAWELVAADTLIRSIGEDRTRITTAAIGAYYVRSADVADMAACNLPQISLDFLGGSLDAALRQDLDFRDRIPDEERQPYAVWSWRSGDRGTHGPAALFHGSDGRWSSAPLTEMHRFACARPRSETTRDAQDWTDRLGAEWRVTSRSGTWYDGGRACLEEFGDEGFVFSVPVNGFMNGQLRLMDPLRGDVWLNYSRLKDEWLIDRRPVANAGPDQVLECTSRDGTSVRLDGTASSDPDGDPVVLEWTGAFGTAAGPAPVVTLPAGRQVVKLVADDTFAGAARDEVSIDIVDTTPPEIHDVSSSPPILWPPNHRMIPVTLAVSVSDMCDPAVHCRIVSVSSNEPSNGVGGGRTASDWTSTGPLTLDLRAERSGTGAGRVYTVTVECTDAAGNASRRTVTVGVPHDARAKRGG